LIVDTFYTAPAQLAAAIVGATDPVATIDAIWQSGGTVAEVLWRQGGLSYGNWGFDIAGTLVWLLMGILCVYAMFLIALSNIALAVLLALGPIFIALLLFESTKRFFAAWLGQLANYALITILDGDACRAAAASRQFVCRANGRTRRRDSDRRCLEHDVDRGPGLARAAPDHADCGGALGRLRAKFHGLREPIDSLGIAWGLGSAQAATRKLWRPI
jgi:hypothetical protein